MRASTSLLIACMFQCVAAPAQDAAIDFAHDVAPILKKHCARCHLGGKHEGKLALDAREALVKAGVIVPGKSADSELIARITSDDPLERMPSKGDPLPAADIQTLRNYPRTRLARSHLTYEHVGTREWHRPTGGGPGS